MTRPASDTDGKLGKRLRIARERRNISARELDRLARLTEGHTSVIESRKVGVSAATAVSLAGILGVSVEWLVKGESRTDIPHDPEWRDAEKPARRRRSA